MTDREMVEFIVLNKIRICPIVERNKPLAWAVGPTKLAADGWTNIVLFDEQVIAPTLALALERLQTRMNK